TMSMDCNLFTKGSFNVNQSLKTFAFVAVLVMTIMVLPLIAGAAGNAAGGTSDATTSQAGVDKAYALVQLKGDPLATYVKTKPAQGKKIDFNSTTVKSYRAQLSALRNDFKIWLHANAPKAKVTGEFDISLNAVAVELNGATLDTLRTSPLVLSAEYEALYYPNADDPDLTLIHAIDAW